MIINEDKIKTGIFLEGIKVINFASLLHYNEFKFNNLLKEILKVCHEAYNKPVEIEFACSIFTKINKLYFGFLQIRPIAISEEIVGIDDKELFNDTSLVSSDKVLGNSTIDKIYDVVYVKQECFEKESTK